MLLKKSLMFVVGKHFSGTTGQYLCGSLIFWNVSVAHRTPSMSSTKTGENKLRCSVEKACQPIIKHTIRIKKNSNFFSFYKEDDLEVGVKSTLPRLELVVLGGTLSIILMQAFFSFHFH